METCLILNFICRLFSRKNTYSGNSFFLLNYKVNVERTVDAVNVTSLRRRSKVKVILSKHKTNKQYMERNTVKMGNPCRVSTLTDHALPTDGKSFEID